jgi:hypothetical protein
MKTVRGSPSYVRRVKKMPPRSAFLPGGEHAQVLGGRFGDQAAREGADQRTFLRTFGGAEGRREELCDCVSRGFS